MIKWVSLKLLVIPREVRPSGGLGKEFSWGLVNAFQKELLLGERSHGLAFGERICKECETLEVKQPLSLIPFLSILPGPALRPPQLCL